MSFTAVCQRSELTADQPLRAEIDGIELCIVLTRDGEVHAIDDLCTHGDVSLSEGDVTGCKIECWGHGSLFDLRTGEPDGPPAFEPVRVYPVKLDDTSVLVDVAHPISQPA